VERSSDRRAWALGALRRHPYHFRAFFGDAETRETIRSVHRDHCVILEPHGAVGWAGLSRFLLEDENAARLTAISLETAHPAKFPEEVCAVTGIQPEAPPSLAGLDAKPEKFGEMAADYGAFKARLQAGY